MHLATKMNELNFPQATDYYWFHSNISTFQLFSKKEVEQIIIKHKFDPDDYQIIAAPHIGELLEWLPESVIINHKDGGASFFHLNIKKIESNKTKKLEVNYHNLGSFNNVGFSETDNVEACATMLIGLVVNKLFDPKSLCPLQQP